MLSISTSVGLVGTLVLLSIIEYDKSQEMQLQGGIKGDASNERQVLASESICNIEADEYFFGIKDDLGQADKLVSDVLNNLAMNFNYISKLTSSHHSMVLGVCRIGSSLRNFQGLSGKWVAL